LSDAFNTLLKIMEPRKEEKLEQLERLLHSHALQSSDSLRAFLRFVVLRAIDNRKDDLKEYTIGVEVFGRSPNYDPRSDSVVRVQAKRLRSKLEEYYATEGKNDKVLIELPKGHYTPVFSYLHARNGPATASAQAATAAIQPPSNLPNHTRERYWLLVLGIAVTLLLIAVALLTLSNRDLRQQIQQRALADSERFGLVWEPFLKNSDPTLLVLSNPALYRFSNAMDPDLLVKKSVKLTSEQARHLAEVLGDKFLVKNNLAPRLVLSTDEYTGIGEAIGLHRITDLFRTAGHSVLLKQSRTVSPEDLKNHNVVLLGSVWVNEWSGKLTVKEDFTYTGRATIENHNPLPGELREYTPKFDESSGKLIEDHALITVKPNISERNTVMVLAGIHSEGTEAAAEYVVSMDYLSNLNQRLRQLAGPSGPPKYYQALLKVAVDNGIPTTISLLTIHELKVE
jgi:hypothetical protein